MYNATETSIRCHCPTCCRCHGSSTENGKRTNFRTVKCLEYVGKCTENFVPFVWENVQGFGLSTSLHYLQWAFQASFVMLNVHLERQLHNDAHRDDQTTICGRYRDLTILAKVRSTLNILFIAVSAAHWPPCHYVDIKTRLQNHDQHWSVQTSATTDFRYSSTILQHAATIFNTESMILCRNGTRN